MKQNSYLSSKSLLLLLLMIFSSCFLLRSQEQLTHNSSKQIFETYMNSVFGFLDFQMNDHYSFTNSSGANTFQTTNKSKWITYKNDVGAFSVKLPHEPTDISRDAPDPTNPEAEPYHLSMFTANDEKKNNIYLIRYNDMPNGFYLNDISAGFASIEENFQGKATVLSEPKEIKLGTIEGREIELMVQGQYHAIMRIYIRGNRIYVLMVQKMSSSGKVLKDDDFFKSFKLENYDYTKPTTYKPEGDTFEVNLFGNVKVMKDTVGYESTKLKNTINHYSINPSSGGLYQINSGALQEYVQIKDLNEFYNDHVSLFMVWNDSIIAQKEINVDGHPGIMYLIENQYSKVVERHHMWLDNDRMFLMTGYLSKEEREHPFSEALFNSFKNDSSKDKPFDRSVSKSDLLFKDLHSKDTLRFNRAFGAFEYYKFENSDLPKLYEGLAATYKDTIYSTAIKELIIREFPSVHDHKTVATLKNLYTTDFIDDEELKAAIVSTLPAIDEDDALEVYKELLTTAPPLKSENYTWTLLAPFRDSIAFATDNYKLLSSLTPYELYRSSVLDISTGLLLENPEKKSLVLDEQKQLLKFAKSDLENYIISKNDTLTNSYTYLGLMYSYLSFINETGLNSEITENFTNEIIKLDDNQWFATSAIAARIKSGQVVDQTITNRLMDSLNYRFEIMKAYHNVGGFKKVPDDYKKPEAFAELSLHSNLYEDDYEPESSEFMGEITKNDLLYYAYKVKYDEGDDGLISYIVTVGPIKDVSQMTELELYNIYSDWDQLDIAKWKEQAKLLIPDESELED